MIDVTHQLEELAEAAPAALSPQVLLETGVADGYIRYEPRQMWVAFNPRGISAIHLGESRHDFEQWFRQALKREAYPVEAMPAGLLRRLEKALETGRIGALPIDWESMSPFQRRVLRKTAEILPGEVRPYSWVAREIGSPKASRAVGTALARNPVPFVVPCHRVVRNDGSLGNYYYGTDMKRAILADEGLDTEALADRVTRGVRLTGSDTTHIYCNPTCRDARRTTPRHRVEFSDATAARAAGYRPCRHCRPGG